MARSSSLLAFLVLALGCSAMLCFVGTTPAPASKSLRAPAVQMEARGGADGALGDMTPDTYIIGITVFGIACLFANISGTGSIMLYFVLASKDSRAVIAAASRSSGTLELSAFAVDQTSVLRSRDSDDEDEDDCYRGVDHEVIEGHTVGHTFHVASSVGGCAGNPEHLKCMVCMEEFREGEALRSLPCLHRYHQQCIDQWLSRNAECPICKQDITAPQDMPPPSAQQGARSRFTMPWRS
ncbi:rnf12-b [Symbiodinium natans]|uniref:Rnf12-b protein n=1 Tax=Symbiodinium natans TaxID=878477 RepID=A0A812QKU4_9DINO|nr:rnf12-b [Symbiodinium natans]